MVPLLYPHRTALTRLRILDSDSYRFGMEFDFGLILNRLDELRTSETEAR